jgi:hypothetical protein
MNLTPGYTQTVAITTGITIEEFERLPDALAYYHELVNGELVDVSGNTVNHNSLRDHLVLLLAPPCKGAETRKDHLGTRVRFDGNAH